MAHSRDCVCLALGAVALCFLPVAVRAGLALGAGEFVQDGGVDLVVPGYSVPSFVLWDGDGLQDLIVGEGGAAGKVRIYRNVGSETAPQFAGFTYAQSEGSDLVVAGFG